MSVKQSFKELFQFTSSERKGVVVLLIILALVLVLRIAAPYFNPHPNNKGVQIEYVELKDPEQEAAPIKEHVRPEIKKERREIDRFTKFDPNQASYEELLSYGFTAFSANNLIKYRVSGGEFSTVQDLTIIYGVDSTLINSLAHQVVIDRKVIEKSSVKVNFESIGLNSSDTTQLKLLPSVGPVLSKRIVKYRNLLGGFYNKEQLLEVYGIDEDTYEIIAAKILIDTLLLQKMDLNKATEKEFSKHPYVTKYQARAIVKYRELMGDFKQKQELTHNHIFTKEQFDKAQHYFNKP